MDVRRAVLFPTGQPGKAFEQKHEVTEPALRRLVGRWSRWGGVGESNECKM